MVEVEKKFSNIYYDTSEYALGKNDIWLRNIDGKWELRIPIHQGNGAPGNKYQEIKGEENIRQVFGIAAAGDFASDIAEFGYAAFCEFTNRESGNEKDDFELEGKNILEYLKNKKPKHYQALIDAGVIEKK